LALLATVSYSTASPLPSSITSRLEGTIDARQSPLLLRVTLVPSSLISAKVDSVLVQPSEGFVEVTHLPVTVELGY
jgi:hypothetical protein